MIKQHYIVYDQITDKYWFILPDDTEKEVSPQLIKDVNFNAIYRKMYVLFTHNINYYNYLKDFSVNFMVPILKRTCITRLIDAEVPEIPEELKNMLIFKVKDKLYDLSNVAFVFIDCQNDFITGSLGTKEAQEAIKIIRNIAEIPIKHGYVTMDTHYDKTYLNTREGHYLPIKHCIVDDYENDGYKTPFLFDLHCLTGINKTTFGTLDLPVEIKQQQGGPECIVFTGFCTDICVMANVLITQAYFNNEIPIVVIEDGCAGSTVENHEAALKVLRSCQIDVVSSKDLAVEPLVG